jgi:hypothetical protein
MNLQVFSSYSYKRYVLLSVFVLVGQIRGKSLFYRLSIRNTEVKSFFNTMQYPPFISHQVSELAQ